MSQSNLFQKYCFDACAILDFWDVRPKTRPYHVKVKSFRTIWEHISSEVEKGTIIIPKIVAEEVKSEDAELKEFNDWLEYHKKAFVDHNHCILELQKIVSKYPIYTSNKGSLVDAIVVAIAMSCSITVITSENYSTPHNPVKPKIPNVCEDFSVKWLHLPEFFKEEGL